MNDKNRLIAEYQAAIRAMRDGRFDLSITADHGDEIGGIGRDLNELAQELDRKFIEINKMQKISEEIIAGLFIDDVMNRIYDSFRSVIPYNRMGCALLSDENRLLTACWERSDVPEMRLKAGFAAPMAGSSLQNIIGTGLPRILNDLEAYLAEHPISAATRLLVDEGMRSNLTCPLIARGKPIGFLFFTSMEKNTYQHIHQNTFLQIAGQVSVLIEKSQLYQQLLELNQRLLLAQRALEYQAKHDALTAIYNRGAIIELLEGQLARAGRRNQPVCIAMLDVDHFKRINDTHGHPAGDGVLVAITSRIKKCLREYDFIGRYGGEEFLVVFGDASYETAITATERIRLAVSDEAIRVDGKALAVTVSIGVAAVGNATGFGVDQLIAAADQALYRAKSGGRNRVEAGRL